MNPVTTHLLDYLQEEPPSGAPAVNHTTMLQQGERAQSWLIETYLKAWLEIIGGLRDAGYPKAFVRGNRLKRLANEVTGLGVERSKTDLVFFLEGLQFLLRSVCAEINAPAERSMQWGIWARDVAMAVALGFEESEILDPVVCEAIAPCVMYAAFLVGMVVEDDGTCDEIEVRMFEQLPRELLALIRETPNAPEA